MKKVLSLLTLTTALLLLPTLSHAGSQNSALFLNARLNANNQTVPDCPFDKDLSYGLSYAIYDGSGYLELGLNYAPSSSLGHDVDLELVNDVWTPFARLVMVDQFVAIGIGLRGNYISFTQDADFDSGWADLLYELYVGLEIPAGALNVGGGVYYSFSKWSNAFSDFDADYLDYGIHLGFSF